MTAPDTRASAPVGGAPAPLDGQTRGLWEVVGKAAAATALAGVAAAAGVAVVAAVFAATESGGAASPGMDMDRLMVVACAVLTVFAAAYAYRLTGSPVAAVLVLVAGAVLAWAVAAGVHDRHFVDPRIDGTGRLRVGVWPVGS